MAVALAAVVALAGAGPTLALDLSTSGYATLGAARSDQPYTYQRFIDDGGTLRRDSIAGLQVDAKLSDTVGATLQAKLAPSLSSDRRYQASLSWAFVTWRPSNDWLVRLGKQRVPIYLFSENYDVGASYEFARLPTEMYSLVPSNDAGMLSVGKTWAGDAGEWALDGYWGRATNDFRGWLRDGIPGAQPAGAVFTPLDFAGGGLVLAYKTEALTLRLGLHRAEVKRHDGGTLPNDYPFVSIAPGIGYYQVDPALPGPGVSSVARVVNTTWTLGADVAMPARFRLIGEVAHSRVPESRFAPQAVRGYVALLRRIDRWTPYASFAFLRSPSDSLDAYDRVNGNALPAPVPGAAAINSAQRAGADQIIVFDQRSFALGTSYALSPTSKLKGEFLRSRIGRVSSLVDAPPGGNVRRQDIDVLSFSYSVVF